MISYKDKAFCCSKEHKPDCDRIFTKEDETAAKKWWKGDNPPIAWARFCGGEDRWGDLEVVG